MKQAVEQDAILFYSLLEKLTMIDWSNCPAVERRPEKVSGAWVFRGTRVPVVALFENLKCGAALKDFLAR